MKEYLYSAQERFYGCSATRKLFLGGRLSGKTTTLGLEAIEAAAWYGKDVGWYAPTHRLAHSAADTLQKLVMSFDHEGEISSVQYIGKERIDFTHGGTIRFSALKRGQNITARDDIVALDEANHFNDDAWLALSPALDRNHQTRFLAALTPREGYDTVTKLQQEGFTTIPVPTRANPNVNMNEYRRQRKTLTRAEFRREFLCGLPVDEHLLVSYDDADERVHECVLCDLDIRVPLDADDEGLAQVEGWAVGQAMDVQCA